MARPQTTQTPETITMTTYDQAKLIDDAWAARDVAEARVDGLKDQLETSAYILTELLKKLGYAPAKNINEHDCVGFVETLIEDHGGEDDVVEEIAKALQPVDTEDPGVPRLNPWIKFQDLYGFDDETQPEMKSCGDSFPVGGCLEEAVYLNPSPPNRSQPSISGGSI